MTDINSFTSATPLVVIAVAVICSLLKPLLEASAVPPTSKTHDTIIRLLAIALGVLVVLAANLLVPRVGGITGAVIFAAVVEGGKAGIVAIVTFHLLTSSYFDSADGTQTASLTVEAQTPAASTLPPSVLADLAALVAPLLKPALPPPAAQPAGPPTRPVPTPLQPIPAPPPSPAPTTLDAERQAEAVKEDIAQSTSDFGILAQEATAAPGGAVEAVPAVLPGAGG